MKINTVYTRNFSKIRNIQESEQILYNIFEQNVEGSTVYGLNIVSKTEQGEETEPFLLGESKELAMNVICYAYENSIKVGFLQDICKDLVVDLMNKCSIMQKN